jgi:hypothetical protein
MPLERGVMRAGDLMKDPFYVRLIYEMESHIHTYDLMVLADEEFNMKDSDVKSAIRKALGLLRGKGGMKTPKKREERIKGRLALELVGIYEGEAKTSGLGRADYSNALLAVEESLITRRELGGHSRGYLDFLKEFFAEVESETNEDQGEPSQ